MMPENVEKSSHHKVKSNEFNNTGFNRTGFRTKYSGTVDNRT